MVAQLSLEQSVLVRVQVSEPIWRYGQEAKTSPSQGEIMGSIPISATIKMIPQSRDRLGFVFIFLETSLKLYPNLAYHFDKN